MVYAGEISGIAAGVEANERPAMRASILEGVDSAVGRTGDNNRRVPDARGFVVFLLQDPKPVLVGGLSNGASGVCLLTT